MVTRPVILLNWPSAASRYTLRHTHVSEELDTSCMCTQCDSRKVELAQINM